MRYLLILTLLLAGTAHAATKATHSARPAANSNGAGSAGNSSRYSGSTSARGSIEVEPDFGFAFISPGDVNGLIKDQNDNLQKQGVKSFNAEEIGTTTYYGLAATYRVLPELGLGLGFHHLAASSEATAKINELNINGNYNISANFLTAESRITVYGNRKNGMEAVLSPFVGMGFYKASTSFSGSAMQNGSMEETSSAKGAVFGAAATARYWFNPSVAAGLTAGYRFAKSGDLKIDSQKNTADSVGSSVDNNGKKIAVDASSFMIAAGLTWAI